MYNRDTIKFDLRTPPHILPILDAMASNPLDYHKPERPKPEARPGFRFGAWVLFIGGLAAVAGAFVALVQGDYRFGITIILAGLPGCWMMGRIAIAGRL